VNGRPTRFTDLEATVGEMPAKVRFIR
jgi:hypothetical protein